MAAAKKTKTPGPARGVHVALLRGINVGGKNIVPMADLAALFRDAGCSAVRTYIQSGNVVFTHAAPDDLAATLAARIEDRFGCRAPVVIRSAADLARAARDNPYLAEGVPEDQLHLMCLAGAPDPAAVAKLDPARSPDDRFIVSGRDVYLHLPHGAARTKLTNDWFDRALRTVSTARNWRTVQKLIELSAAEG